MNDSAIEYNYNALCDLYTKYKSLISNDCLAMFVDDSYCIDDILREIEKYPITWKFYDQQCFKFSQEFEDLIIFKELDYINKDG